MRSHRVQKLATRKPARTKINYSMFHFETKKQTTQVNLNDVIQNVKNDIYFVANTKTQL